MAIQIRRGTNTEWENNNPNIVVGEPAIVTDAERFFVGTASGDYAEFANLDIIAPAYDTSASYVVGDVINRHGKLYSCNTPCSGTFNASYWDEKSLAEILKDLENEIDYAQYEIGYANGKLITIDNGASEIPVKDLTVDIEAVQDLHGYDNPWVGGAGKNLLDNTLCTPRENNGVTRIINSDGTITLNGTSTVGSLWWRASETMNVSFKAGTYTPSVNVTGMTLRPKFRNAGEKNGTFTLTEDDVLINVRFTNTVGTVFNNTKVSSQIELGSTATAFEPYTNICPISGWDEVNVTRTGLNLFNPAWVINRTAGGITSELQENGTIHLTGTATASNRYVQTNDFLCLPAGTYRISGNPVEATARKNHTKIDSNGVFTVDGKELINFSVRFTSGDTVNVYESIILTKGSEIIDYEPYIGTTYTTDLGQVVYGGTLDVTTGVLSITHGYVTLDGTVNWTMGTAGNFRYFDASMSALNANSLETNVVSNMFNQQGTYPYAQIGGAKKIRVCFSINDTSITTVAQLQALLTQNALQVLYPLATPQVVQLTPTQVRTVLGTNNIWNQMNSNNELAYRISNALN